MEFDVELILNNLEKIKNEFAKGHRILWNIYNRISVNYNGTFGSHTCNIVFKTNTDLYFTYKQNNIIILSGLFDLGTSSFAMMSRESNGLGYFLKENNREDELHQVRTHIKECILHNQKYFNVDTLLETKPCLVTYDSSDITAALRAAFKEYSSFTHDPTRNVFYQTTSVHNNIAVTIEYDENETTRHDHFYVMISHMYNEYITEFFRTRYDLGQTEYDALGPSTQEVPDGFDEGFAPFILLGSLMT